MSLRFCYFPPKPIRVVRHRRIHFTVGTPKVTFTTIRHTQKAENKIARSITERERKAPPEESAPPRKEKKAPKVGLQMADYSMSGCFELLRNMRQRKSIKQLLELRGSERDEEIGFTQRMGDVLDLEMIEDKMMNCEYVSVSEFFGDLEGFFDYTANACGDDSSYPEYGRIAVRFLREIRSLADDYKSKHDSIVNEDYGRFSGVEAKLSDVVHAKLGEIGVSRESVDLVELSSKLNTLEGRSRTRAEYIIKMYCPLIPYYVNSVDLNELPYPAIESLSKLVNA